MYHLIDWMNFLVHYYWVAFIPSIVLLLLQSLRLVTRTTMKQVVCVSFAIMWVASLFFLRHLINANIKNEIVTFLSHNASDYNVLINGAISDDTSIVHSLRRLKTNQEYRGFSKGNHIYSLAILRNNETYKFKIRSHDSNPDMKLVIFNTHYKNYIFTGRF
ncbi:Hypothetical protein VS_II1472 [Vibrio atlanticus]|uniref:Uncharacterized protein n=1 Tax=Vibrio atlanticus (strain LGP32) TaxID=575788 RepID=B7VU00_VIBA3|nr:Hypothetical protein VS_II1472 [Vibrio atlanticus]